MRLLTQTPSEFTGPRPVTRSVCITKYWGMDIPKNKDNPNM